MKHFYRCLSCLSVVATEEKIPTQIIDAQFVYGRKEILPTCGLCGGNFEYMGEVNGGHLVQYRYDVPCDGRCTGATGPTCDCSCGGENHGTNRLVKITVEQGKVPVLQTPATEKAIETAREYKEALAAAKHKLAALPYYEAYAAGRWISDKDAWWRLENISRNIAEAKKLKVHKTRIKKLQQIAAM